MSDEEVIRYGAGGKPYKGQVGLQSTDVEPTPEDTPVVETPQVEMDFVEDDTPVTDEDIIEKTKKGGK